MPRMSEVNYAFQLVCAMLHLLVISRTVWEPWLLGNPAFCLCALRCSLQLPAGVGMHCHEYSALLSGLSQALPQLLLVATHAQHGQLSWWPGLAGAGSTGPECLPCPWTKAVAFWT